VDGLDAVLNRTEFFPQNRAVVSMSIGGPCEDGFCIDDPIVDTIDDFISPANITVVVAAGNEACDACYASPAGANTAITVGATDDTDDFAFFSNWGHCIDVLGPGVSIVSVCSELILDECDAGQEDLGTQSRYWTISGTSMACPHVAGTVAQWFQKDNTLTPAAVREALQCNGVDNTIEEVFGDTPTKNILLQIPDTGTSATCNLGTGCTDSCNGNGWCDTSATNQSTCNCEKEWDGTTCNEVYDEIITCNDSNSSIWTSLYLESLGGDGWETGSIYELYDETSNTQVMTGTMECGIVQPVQNCLDQEHSYSLTFSKKDANAFWIFEPCSTTENVVTSSRKFMFSWTADVCQQTSEAFNKNEDDDLNSVEIALAVGIPAFVIIIGGLIYYYRGHLKATRQSDNTQLGQHLMD